MPDRRPTRDARSAIGIGAGLAIGAGVGAAIGVAMDQVALWLAIGIGVGMAIGAGLGATGRTVDRDDPSDAEG